MNAPHPPIHPAAHAAIVAPPVAAPTLSPTPSQLPHSWPDFEHFHRRLLGTTFATERNAYRFYTDDRALLAEAHEKQRARPAGDPDYASRRQGRPVTFDPAARSFRRSFLTMDGAWFAAMTDNRPAACGGNSAALAVCINACDGEGMKFRNFVSMRAFAVDADTPVAAAGVIGFIGRTGLYPSMIVASSVANCGTADEFTKLHVYWCLDRDSRLTLAPAAWSAMQRAIAASCNSDASLDDPPQVLRVPGTLNLKDPLNPSPVRLLWADGPDYSYEDFLKRSGLEPKFKRPHRAVATILRDVDGNPVAPPSGRLAALVQARFAAGIAINANFSAGVYDSVDVRAAASCCPALAETFATAGAAHQEPLWFLMLGLAAVDHDPRACAHAMSHAHPAYTPAETEAKLERVIAARIDEDIGWISCRQIAQHHPACAACYYHTGSIGPLTLAARIAKAREA